MKVFVYRIEYEKLINKNYIIWVKHRNVYYNSDDDNWYKSFYTDKFPRKKFSKKFCILLTYLQVSKRLSFVGNESIMVNGFEYTLVAEYELP